jgi:hypothetical protein
MGESTTAQRLSLLVVAGLVGVGLLFLVIGITKA